MKRMITPGSPKFGLAAMVASSSATASTKTAPPGVARAASVRPARPYWWAGRGFVAGTSG